MDELDSKLWHLFPYGEAQVEVPVGVDDDNSILVTVRDRYSKLLRALTQPDDDEQDQVNE